MPSNLKVNCDRSALVDALAMASGVVPSRTTSPVLTCLKLTAKDGELVLRATDGQIALALAVPSVEVVGEGEALVPADKLGQIIRTCEDSTVAIEVEKNVATVKGEGSTFKIFGYDPKEYPANREPQSTGSFEVTAESLRRLIARTLFATAVENARFAINGVLMERKGKRIRLVGTDGKRLAVAAGACSGEGDMTFIVPSKSLNILVKMLELLTASVQERMEAVTAQEEKPDMRLRAMFDSHFTYFKAHPEYLMAIFATNFMEPSPVIDTAIKNLMEVMRHHLRAVVSAGQKAGTFTRVIPTDMLVQIVMGTFRLHMLQWRMTGKNTDVKKVGNKLINTVLTLIAAR